MIELRIHEQYASMMLRSDEGRSLMGLVRQVFLPMHDPRVKRVAELDQQTERAFFSYWRIHRRYTASELRDAALLHLVVTAVFEPAGEECGTEYDYMRACPACGAGRTRGELRLDLTRVPASADIACTIPRDEVIVSDRLARLLRESDLRGLDLRPVLHRSGPGGRRRKKTPSPSVWHELVVTSDPVHLSPETRAGESPFDDGSARATSCPLGDTIGLNLISELHVARQTVPDADIMKARAYVGTRRGLLVPVAPVLVTPRLYEMLSRSKVRGFRAEVAHLS